LTPQYQPSPFTNAAAQVTWTCPATGGKLGWRLNRRTYQTTSTVPAESAGTGFSVGNRPPHGQSWNGNIGEIIVYNGVLSSGARDAIETYQKAWFNL